MFQAELGDKGPYKASINAMRLKLQELQEFNFKAQKIRTVELQEDWEELDKVLYH